MNNNKLIWYEAVTFIHAGIGQVPELIDQPVARESGTGFPYLPGSGAKGGLKSAWNTVGRLRQSHYDLTLDLQSRWSHGDVLHRVGWGVHVQRARYTEYRDGRYVDLATGAETNGWRTGLLRK